MANNCAYRGVTAARDIFFFFLEDLFMVINWKHLYQEHLLKID